MNKVYVIHENEAWIAPLRRRLEDLGTPYEAWNLVEGIVPIDDVPPGGVFYNRMSASSHTRDHRFSPEYAAVVLSWLEAHGRRLVNDSRALALEINKASQYQLLKRADVRTPATTVAVGPKAVIEAAHARPSGPVILKPNRGGKGDGVRLFRDAAGLEAYVLSAEYSGPVDGISLVQEYIESPDRSITRAEFVGGRFQYAVRVDTAGGFELCPADVCQIPGTAGPKFRILGPDEGLEPHVIRAVQMALLANGVEVAGVEFIRDAAGSLYAYDINTNTNYNTDAEAEAGIFGMERIAAFLTETLEDLENERGFRLPLAV